MAGYGQMKTRRLINSRKSHETPMDTNNFRTRTGCSAVGEGMKYIATRILMSTMIVLLSPIVILGMVLIVWSKE